MNRRSRRWDGAAETPADTRFFDARESGYSGPLDRDGYRVTSGDDAAILRRMAQDSGDDTSWWTGPDEPGHPAQWLALLVILAVVGFALWAVWFVVHDVF